MAPGEGFEPPAKRLTAACSTTELPGISRFSPPDTSPFGGRRYSRQPRRTPHQPRCAGELVSGLLGGRSALAALSSRPLRDAACRQQALPSPSCCLADPSFAGWRASTGRQQLSLCRNGQHLPLTNRRTACEAPALMICRRSSKRLLRAIIPGCRLSSPHAGTAPGKGSTVAPVPRSSRAVLPVMNDGRSLHYAAGAGSMLNPLII